MDGFAVRAADTPGPAAGRRAGRRRPAGRTRPLEPGEAMGIATGGVVPEGADAVVPIENVVEHDNDDRDPGRGCAGRERPSARRRRRGRATWSSAPATRLGPAQLGALRRRRRRRARRARAARARPCSATGTELRRPGEPLGAGQIYESNAPMLAAALAGAGAERRAARAGRRRRGGAPRGDRARRSRRTSLVTSGGVSVGPHDLVRARRRELGVEEVFWRVAVKPGKPRLLRRARRGRSSSGCPGNPVSALVGFELFVRPALRALQGVPSRGPLFDVGRLGAPVRRNADARRARPRAQRGSTDGTSCSSRSRARSRT